MTFIRGTYALLGELEKNQKPIALIEMPTDAKVAVAELIAVESQLKPQEMSATASRLDLELMQQYGLSIAGDWFNYNSVAQCLNFQSDSASHAAAQ